MNTAANSLFALASPLQSVDGWRPRRMPTTTSWLWADWMVRHVPATVLAAAGSDLDVFWFNNQPALTSQRFYRHWVNQMPELERIVERTERLGLQYHNGLKVQDRHNARVGSVCLDGFTVPTFVLGRELVEPRLHSTVWSLVQVAAEAWWTANRWQQPEDYAAVVTDLVSPVRELELYWPYITETQLELGVPA